MSNKTIEKLQNIPSDDPEILEALEGTSAEIASETAAGFGIGYSVGNAVIPPITLGVLPLLDSIDSPFLDGSLGRLSASDIMRALYVLAKGYEACEPVMGIARRKASLHAEREFASKDPELYERYLKRLDDLEKEWMLFDADAADFWDNEVGNSCGLQEASETMFLALKDALCGLSAIPGNGGGKKKRASILNGRQDSAKRRS